MDVVYRASELGGCTRFLIGKRMGYTEMPPPAKFAGYFERGEKLEDTLVELLMEKGTVITRRQEEVLMRISDTITVVGHIDGVVDEDVGFSQYLWECKRMTPQWFDDLKDKGWASSYPLLEKYKWQVSAYMHATGLQLRLDIACERDGVLDTWSLYQEMPFYDETQIRVRVLTVESAAQQGELGDTCDKPNYPCPLYYLPGHDEEDDTDEVVSALAAAIIESKRDVEAATKRDKDLRAKLLVQMGERKRVRTEVATVSVQRSYKTVTDKERMEADGFKLEDYQTKEEGDEYVRITPRKGAVKDDRDTDES